MSADVFIDHTVELVRGSRPPWKILPPVNIINLDMMRQYTRVMPWDKVRNRNNTGKVEPEPIAEWHHLLEELRSAHPGMNCSLT